MAPNHNTDTPTAHICLSPGVVYVFSTTDDSQVVSRVVETEQVWTKTRDSCKNGVEVPLHRSKKSQAETGKVTSRDLRDLCDTEKSSGSQYNPIKRHFALDLLSEASLQLKSIAPPVESCQAPKGRHIVGILSETSKDIVERNKRGSLHSTGHTTGLSDQVLRDSINNPLTHRKLVFRAYSIDKQSFVRCSFSDDLVVTNSSAKGERPSLKTEIGAISEESGFRELSREVEELSMD